MSGDRALRSIERGITLMEALVALLVLAFGIATVARVQAHLRLQADIGRQRAEAVRLAQEDVESVRAYAVAAASAGARAWADIGSSVRTVDAASGLPLDTAYRVVRIVSPDAAASALQASVVVTWDDRRGEAQRVILEAIVAAHDPTHAATLALAPAGRPVRGAHGRGARIPLSARDLGDGRSAERIANGLALVFDNATGAILSRCSIPAGLGAIAAADLTGCDAQAGQLLSGVVRFALGPAPDPEQARDTPLDLTVAVSTSGGLYARAPACVNEARKAVHIASGGGTLEVAVPIGATPADLGLSTWSDTGDRYVAYRCLVYPRADGAWSGRANIVPVGWTIGTSPSDRRVCRYAADRDGSGRIDANDEHPLDYVDVRGPLVGQNFLVVAGDRACPTSSGVHVVGAVGDVFVDRSTVPHQP